MPKPPNILVFMSDQEQGQVLHPSHPCLTPHATRLANEGLLFGRAHCPTAHCCPSRATFMTGLYPSRHGVFNNVSTSSAIHRGLADGTATFAEALRDAGYRLAYTGKWHVTNLEGPSDRGFEELVIDAGKGTDMEGPIDRFVERAKSARGRERERGEVMRPDWTPFKLYGSYRSTSARGFEDSYDWKLAAPAIDILPKLAADGRPWMLYVGVLGPHDPYRVPESFLARYARERIPLPESYDDALDDKPRIYQRMRRQVWDQLGAEGAREAVHHYWAYCSFVDEILGAVLAALEATGQAEDTLVVRTSDHGDYVGAHGLFLKGVPAFREAYHIPMIARWPRGIIAPGREVDEFVTLADLAPTFLELAGIPVPAGLTGRSLRPFLGGETPRGWPDEVHAQLNGLELAYTQRCVSTRDFKYVYNGFDFDELYDLRRDPQERVNVSERPEYREAKQDLVRRLWRFARREDDRMVFSAYGTGALIPWGPAAAL